MRGGGRSGGSGQSDSWKAFTITIKMSQTILISIKGIVCQTTSCK